MAYEELLGKMVEGESIRDYLGAVVWRLRG